MIIMLIIAYLSIGIVYLGWVLRTYEDYFPPQFTAIMAVVLFYPIMILFMFGDWVGNKKKL